MDVKLLSSVVHMSVKFLDDIKLVPSTSVCRRHIMTNGLVNPAGEAHSAALTSNGFLFMWGSNDKGQLGLPAAADVAAQSSVSLC